MDVLTRLAESAIVPVVVLDDAKDAAATANALLRGGIDVMEIAAVAAQCPDMLVGAGTVITLEQCKQAVACGAKFIVSPGFDSEVVKWCVDNGIAVTPGCVTPTEIMAAMKLGLKVVKFFPAGVYGGLSAMKALAAPFGGIKFIPTGGVNAQNLGEFVAAPFVHAVGGSWVCAEARKAALGFEVAHVGINCDGADTSAAVADALHTAFGLDVKPGNSSNFVSEGIEVMKSANLGQHGHIAVRTNSIPLAISVLKKVGCTCDPATAKYKNRRINAIYLKETFGGFAVHLLQK